MESVLVHETSNHIIHNDIIMNCGSYSSAALSERKGSWSMLSSVF